MRFDCGKKWTIGTWLEEKYRRERWHDYFAWLPVRVADRECRWLETVERRGTYVGSSDFGDTWTWDYRAKGAPNLPTDGP